MINKTRLIDEFIELVSVPCPSKDEKQEAELIMAKLRELGLEPEMDKLRKECAEWVTQDEDVLSYAQFGQVAVKFFERRRNQQYGIDGVHGDAAKQIHPV